MIVLYKGTATYIFKNYIKSRVNSRHLECIQTGLADSTGSLHSQRLHVLLHLDDPMVPLLHDTLHKFILLTQVRLQWERREKI